jgi:GntR family transcriptional regulator, vanillate catabolism transcriptional regulator
MPARPSNVADASQTAKAQVRLRELVLDGELAAGQRITELALVDLLAVSRTPVRAALLALQDEGLLEALPGGGWVVKAFSEAEIRDAIEVRGTLEGLAARLAAERGVAPSLLAEAQQLLDRLDQILAPPALDAAAFSGYVEHNALFHALLARMADSVAVQRQTERAAAQPFASPSAFVLVSTAGRQARDRLVIAHEQHHAVLEAIDRREGARAEALMREHARNAHHNLSTALLSRQGLQRLPGAGLIRRGGRG